MNAEILKAASEMSGVQSIRVTATMHIITFGAMQSALSNVSRACAILRAHRIDYSDVYVNADNSAIIQINVHD